MGLSMVLWCSSLPILIALCIGLHQANPCSLALRQLIKEIWLLELELKRTLQVMHVLGLLMIGQGIDGISRGIWMSSLQGLQDSHDLTQAVYDPLCFDWLLIDSYISQFCLVHQYIHLL
jgi:hypothetical protein